MSATYVLQREDCPESRIVFWYGLSIARDECIKDYVWKTGKRL